MNNAVTNNMETSDRLEIVNRSKSYFLPKKLCSSIPYFKKMFEEPDDDSSNENEIDANKVILDLEETAFLNILSFVYSGIIVLNLDNVLQIYDYCDYLMIDNLKKECSEYFYRNFHIDSLPAILKSICDTSKLITTAKINCFIKRHFLQIANTKAFLDFPIDVIEYICKLDLVIDSEYQVFDVIKLWIRHDGGRLQYITQLMKLVRWCFLDENELKRIKTDSFLENKKDIEEIMCSTNDSENISLLSRRFINDPILIIEIDKATIFISIIEKCNLCCPYGHFKLDETLTDSIITDEHVSDIFYDSGRKCIRLDWDNKKFKYLVTRGNDHSYYEQIYKHIMYSHRETEKWKWFSQDPNNSEDRFLLDVAYSMNLFFYGNFKTNRSYHACTFDDQTCIIKPNLEYFLVDKTALRSQRSTLSKEEGFTFNDLQLFSHGDKLLLLQLSKKKGFVLNRSTKKWSPMFEIKSPGTLIAVSSTYSLPYAIRISYDYRVF